MKASYRWLCELLGPAFTASPKEVAERFTGAGLEVEAVTSFGVAAKSALVAEVVAKRAHPSRPKLTLVTISTGAASEEIVCGAPNVPEPGARVVFAPVGTHLPAKGLTLEPKEIAGVESRGMLCSEAELGLRLSGGDGGIIVLPADLKAELGTPLAQAVPESCDEIFEIGLTPNRPDGLGHVGLARELAALMNLPFTLREAVPARVDPALAVESQLSVRIEEEERCPIYGAHFVKDVKIGPSPLGVQYRLEALGVRAISNAVDVTNLVMLKYGHPIHGFDPQQVRGGTIVVRCAKPGESMVTLDGIKRELVADDLLICDGEGPVALAGVMGGEASGVSPTTSGLLIECAYFSTRGVRRSARRHGMHTESSHRFERGVDPSDVALVLAEAAALTVELCGGTAAASALRVGPGVAAPKPIRLRPARATSLLGLAIPQAEMVSILVRLGCTEVPSSEPESVSFVPPGHRPDLTIEEDLIEEIVRVYGVDRVPSVLPAIRPAVGTSHARKANILSQTVDAAASVGLAQALTFGFTSKKQLEVLGLGASTLSLMNPLTDDRTEMRTSLLPGLFDAAKRARRYGVFDLRLFCVGARFLPQADAPLPREARSFAAVIGGQRDAVLQKAEPCDIFDAKGLALEIVARATGQRAQIRPTKDADRPRYSHPRAAGDVLVGERVIGRIGLVHPLVERDLELDGNLFFIELDLETLEELGSPVPKFQPIPTLPASTRDLAFTVEESVASGDIEQAILQTAGELAESVALFDLFRGGNIPKSHKSLAYRIVYRDPNARFAPEKARTLTDAEVDARQAAVEAALKQQFGAELRA